MNDVTEKTADKVVKTTGVNVSGRTAMLVKLALLAAISVALMVPTQIPFPPLPFLKYDAADIPIMISAFAFGPVAGLMVTFVVSAVQAFAFGGDGIIGFCMHMLATGAFVIVAGNLYKREKSKKNAIKALIFGALAMILTMIFWNILITPLYTGLPRMAVITTMLPMIALFNVLKAGINAIVTFLLYKPLSRFLHR